MLKGPVIAQSCGTATGANASPSMSSQKRDCQAYHAKDKKHDERKTDGAVDGPGRCGIRVGADEMHLVRRDEADVAVDARARIPARMVVARVGAHGENVLPFPHERRHVHAEAHVAVVPPTRVGAVLFIGYLVVMILQETGHWPWRG